MSTNFSDDQDALFDLPPLPAVETTYESWKDVPMVTVVEVFDTWRLEHEKKRSVLSPERHRAIAKAVATYGRQMTLDAIHGCLLSPWHMGRNPRKNKYNDICLILRNAEKIEGFAELFTESESGGGFLDAEA